MTARTPRIRIETQALGWPRSVAGGAPRSLRASRAAAPLVALAVAAIGAAALSAASGAGWTAPARALNDNPYPEVNPCASGKSEITGSIKVCTLILENDAVRVYTEPRRAMVWIQISETGPTAHVSDTVGGVAYISQLTPRDDWYVSIQTWNMPPGVRLESQLVYLAVPVGDARTFTFVCDAPPCNAPAPTSTATTTTAPPLLTREPSAVPTASVTAATTATGTVPSTVTLAATATTTATGTMTATITATTTSTTPAAATATWTEAPTASPTADASPTTGAGTPAATATAGFTATVTATATATVPPTAESTSPLPTPYPVTGTRAYLPVTHRTWR